MQSGCGAPPQFVDYEWMHHVGSCFRKQSLGNREVGCKDHEAYRHESRPSSTQIAQTRSNTVCHATCAMAAASWKPLSVLFSSAQRPVRSGDTTAEAQPAPRHVRPRYRPRPNGKRRGQFRRSARPKRGLPTARCFTWGPDPARRPPPPRAAACR